MTLPPEPDRWTIDLANAQRMEAIAAFGFSERQARFLLNVLLHSGVFVERHTAASRASSMARRARTSSRRWSSGDSRHRLPRASSIAAGCFTSTTSRSGRPSASPTTASGSPPRRDA